MKKKNSLLIFTLLILSACSSGGQDPGFIYTAVASTQTAAAYQTQMAALLFTKTPTQATLRPTMTLPASSTPYIFIPTPSHTPTPTPSATRTPRIRTTWPDWKIGEVVTMPRGSGWNVGTNKKFSDLTGLMVMVDRKNGVVLRSAPNKAIGGQMEEKGSAFTLTGVMNKDPKRSWLFVQVIAANGKIYWVGGSEGDENTDPTYALSFYYPKLTPSPTLTLSPTSASFQIVPPSATPSPTP